MNVGGGTSGVKASRKRKLDSPPPDSPSSPDEDSSGGDGTSCTSLQLTPSKVTYRCCPLASRRGLFFITARCYASAVL